MHWVDDWMKGRNPCYIGTWNQFIEFFRRFFVKWKRHSWTDLFRIVDSSDSGLFEVRTEDRRRIKLWPKSFHGFKHSSITFCFFIRTSAKCLTLTGDLKIQGHSRMEWQKGHYEHWRQFLREQRKMVLIKCNRNIYIAPFQGSLMMLSVIVNECDLHILAEIVTSIGPTHTSGTSRRQLTWMFTIHGHYYVDRVERRLQTAIAITRRDEVDK